MFWGVGLNRAIPMFLRYHALGGQVVVLLVLVRRDSEFAKLASGARVLCFCVVFRARPPKSFELFFLPGDLLRLSDMF